MASWWRRTGWLVVLAVAAPACSSGDGTVGRNGDPIFELPDAPTAEHVDDLDVIETRRFSGGTGGALSVDGVSVSVPAGVSDADVAVSVLSPITVPANELAGPVVGVDHDAAIDAPIEVDWDVSGLTEHQQRSLMLVRWDDASAQWLVEQQEFEVVDGHLRVSIGDWSFWGWIANASQEIQEVFGRRKDPPTCNGGLPGWVDNFVDPDADTSAASMLVCIEDDTADPSVITMRLVNNRTFGQFVDLEHAEPLAWVWEGELPTNIAAGVHSAAAAVLNRPDRVFVPPLHEIAIGIRRPATGVPSQYVSFQTEVGAATIVVDAIAFAAREVNIGDAFDDPLTAVFFELLLECGVADVVAWRGDADDIARSILAALVDCVQGITDMDSTLGRKFQQRVSERIVDLNAGCGTPRRSGCVTEAATKAIKADKVLHAVAGKLKYLKLFELVGYLSDLGLEAKVGPLTWSLNLDGEVRAPGDWTPTCTDVVADQQAWSRNWTTQEIFNTPPLLDFDQYPEFESVLAVASAPLAACSPQHLAAVIDRIFAVGFGTEATADIARRVLDALVLAGTSAPGGPITLTDVMYQFPRGIDWEVTVDDGTRHGVRTGFATSIDIEVRDGKRIDGTVAALRLEYEDLVEEGWWDAVPNYWREVYVPGADRAVRAYIPSITGDGIAEVLVAEVGGRSIEARTYVYINDVEAVNGGKIESFFNSIRIVGTPDPCTESVISTDLGRDVEWQGAKVCLDGWAYVTTGDLGDSQSFVRMIDGRWTHRLGFPSTTCPDELRNEGAPDELLDRVNWPTAICAVDTQSAWDGVWRPTTGRDVRLGEFGDEVSWLQDALVLRGYQIDVDGYFGYGTDAALRQFQRDRGLAVTGVATDEVWNQFGE